MRRPGARAAVAGVVLAVFLAGCGGGSGGVTLAITSGAATQLQTGIAAVHAAVASGDRTQAVQALTSLQSLVTQLRHQGQVSSDRAVAIIGAAADVEAQLGLMPTTTTSTSTTTSTTTTTTPPRQKDHGGGGGGGGD